MKITANAGEAVRDQVTVASDVPRPYLGGRAQAESGSRIIENDYSAWTVTGEPDHAVPRVQQLIDAWRKVGTRQLLNDPGQASIRYKVLSHAACALADLPAMASRKLEAAALTRLAGHARQHGERLQATAEHLFLRSPKASAYKGGPAQAVGGSRIIERDYSEWDHSPAARQAVADGAVHGEVSRLRNAWNEVGRRGLRDGPKPAAARYQELTDAAFALAARFTPTMPSAALPGLLELAAHARKHAIRLEATATEASRATGYEDLPEQVATVATRAKTNGQLVPARDADVRKRKRQSYSRDVRSIMRGKAEPERGLLHEPRCGSEPHLKAPTGNDETHTTNPSLG